MLRFEHNSKDNVYSIAFRQVASFKYIDVYCACELKFLSCIVYFLPSTDPYIVTKMGISKGSREKIKKKRIFEEKNSHLFVKNLAIKIDVNLNVF